MKSWFNERVLKIAEESNIVEIYSTSEYLYEDTVILVEGDAVVIPPPDNIVELSKKLEDNQ